MRFTVLWQGIARFLARVSLITEHNLTLIPISVLYTQFISIYHKFSFPNYLGSAKHSQFRTSQETSELLNFRVPGILFSMAKTKRTQGYILYKYERVKPRGQHLETVKCLLRLTGPASVCDRQILESSF